MHLVREADADLVEHINDRVPPVSKICVARLDDLVVDGREHRHVVPYGRASESDDGVDAESRSSTRGGLDLLSGPLPDAFRITVAPNARVDHVLVPVVDDRLTYCLTVEVIGYRPTAEPVLLQDVSAALQITLVLDGFDDVEMITPTGDLEPVVTPLGSMPAHLFEWQVCPLSGEQRNRSRLHRLGLASGFLETTGVIEHRSPPVWGLRIRLR